MYIVRTEPGAVIGEARIGLDQHMAVGGGKDVVEAVVEACRGTIWLALTLARVGMALPLPGVWRSSTALTEASNVTPMLAI